MRTCTSRKPLHNIFLLLTVALTPFLSITSHGQYVDPAFNGGYTVFDIGTGLDQFDALDIMADGRIVAVGSSAQSEFSDSRILVAVYLPSGERDPEFGANGYYLFPYVSSGIDVAVEPGTNRILVLGDYVTDQGTAGYVLFYLSAQGQIDQSFGTDGMVFGPVIDQVVRFSTVQWLADGSFICSGMTSTLDGSSFIVSKFDPLGLPVDAFGSAGSATTTPGGYLDWQTTMTIDLDGRIVLAGSRDQGFPIVYRLLANGQFDGSFSNGTGYYVGPERGQVEDLSVLSDGRILLTRTARNQQFHYAVMLQRLTADGLNDTTFGDSGYLFAVSDSLLDRLPIASAVSNEGYVVTGFLARTGSGFASQFGILYCDPYGLPVADIGNDGVLIETDPSLLATPGFGDAILDASDRPILSGTLQGPNGSAVLARFRSIPVFVSESTADRPILTVHPNPAQASEQVILLPAGEWKVTVFNALGERVLNLNGASGSLHVPDLTAGYYLVHAQKAAQVRTTRFLRL